MCSKHKCCVCRNEFNEEDLVPTQYKDGKVCRYRCKSCKRLNNLKHRYNMSMEDVVNMLESQDYKCVICNTELLELDSKHVHIDHCHEEGHNRGILCMSCNLGLGFFKDNPESLTRAGLYVIENKKE
jgi:hypothetical protein